MAAFEKTGWRLAEGLPPEPPSTDVIELLVEREQAPSFPAREQRAWLRITIQQLIIKVERIAPPAIARWGRSFPIHQRFDTARAEVQLADQPDAHLHARKEGKMQDATTNRQQVEAQALREIVSEKPLTQEERERLLERRKTEFDEAWEIDPKSPTDHTVVKLFDE